MKLDLKGRLLFLWVCFMLLYSTESFTWTVQPANVTFVTKGEDVSLTWKFTLTADEQNKSQTFYLIQWKKFNQKSSDYDVIASTTFLNLVGIPSYTEHEAPHIEIVRSDQATLLIKNVTTEDEGTYRIEYRVQFGATLIADHQVNVTVLEPPEVVVSKDQDVCEGSTVILSCNATGKQMPNITWTKEEGNGIDSGPLPSVDGLHVISNSNKSTNGTYRCTASNGVGNPVNLTTKVIVGNSSSVDDVVISSNTVVEGYPYNLSCEVSGVPEPSVSWIKVSNGERHAGKLLNFTSISRNDAGNYTCEASNRCGKDSKTEAMDVFFGPELTQFTTSAVHHKVCQNDVISLNCAADAYPPVTSYQLFENGSAILDTNTSGMWSRNMSTMGVFIYKCFANNTYETGNSERILINVYVPPSIQEIDNQKITEGNNVTLTCQASGDPPPETFWIKPDGRRVTKKVLTLTNITSNETGEYRCEATNYCGNVSRTASVYVQYGPKIPIESSNCKEYVKKGDHFSMECPVEGNPQPNITWSEGGRILSHNKSKITLKSQHIGEHIYTCTAYNGIGKPDSLTFLHVVNDIVKKDFIYKMKEKSEFTRQLSEDNKKQIEVQEKITKVIPECHKHEVGKIEFRPGSIIIYIHLSFEKPMGQEALTTMLQEAARKGRFGKNVDPDSITDVSDIPGKPRVCVR
ncbi:hemicentin-1-like [Stylophora pistillata]|uniref:hemicentin-1-like n=1 Tax=Stylophora pistillata TaxID=50429 RepID=UPI000C040C61|nr:hemicentin-1-like [Stylophora pistillata]